MTDPNETFVQNIAEHQNRVFGYIYSMLGDHNRAADVLQETNLVLWRKRESYQPDAPFLPWAFGIARMQVLAHVRDRGRQNCLLDQELVEMVAEEAEQQAGKIEEMRVSLRHCVSELSDKHRQLVTQRYFLQTPIQEVARSMGLGLSATKVTLLRLRRKLAECVQRRLALEGNE